MSAKHNTRKAPNVDDKTGTNGKPASNETSSASDTMGKDRTSKPARPTHTSMRPARGRHRISTSPAAQGSSRLSGGTISAVGRALSDMGRRCYGSTLPGFMIPCGSSAALIRRIVSNSAPPRQAGIR